MTDPDQEENKLKDELDKYKQLYEEERAKSASLEKLNNDLKATIQRLTETLKAQDKDQGKVFGGARSKAGGSSNRSTPQHPGTGIGGARSKEAGGGGGRTSGGASSTASRSNTSSRGDKPPAVAQDSKPAAPEPPQEPNVRDEIVAVMRAAAMGKDAAKLEEAITKAEAAGLSFEANLGKKQLARIRSASS